MLHLTICDDEPAQVMLMERWIKKWILERKIQGEITCCQNGDQFLFGQEDGRTDILILDIDMPGMDGISLARRLRREGGDMQILFVTGLDDYALDGYDVDAVSYLIKPVEEEQLFCCLDRAWERCRKEDPVLLLEMPGGVGRVKLRDIRYLESSAHDTLVYCAQGGGPARSKTGIRQLEEYVGQQGGAFFKIHRSYLVNLAYVARITRTEVVMDGGEVLPVARGRWEALNRAYLEYYRL